MLSLIRGGLQDFSISRTNFDWGIPLPWDPTHVCYVWFDALTNYLTAAGYGADEEKFGRLWPANIHMIGKDILRQHAIYWPAMLMAADIEPPTQVWAHGYLTVGGKKMSKTNLTGIHPFQLVDQFGVDSYRWYFLREVQFGQDGSFSLESMVDRHNAELSNGIGNLASRVLAMLRSYFDGVLPEPNFEGAESDLPAGGRGGRAAIRRGDARGAPDRRARRRLRRRRPREPLHGGAVPVDPGERRREAGRARVDPLRVGGDASRPHDPRVVRDAERGRPSLGAARHRANPRCTAAGRRRGMGSHGPRDEDHEGGVPLPEGRRGGIVRPQAGWPVAPMFHVNPPGCTGS